MLAGFLTETVLLRLIFADNFSIFVHLEVLSVVTREDKPM